MMRILNFGPHIVVVPEWSKDEFVGLFYSLYSVDKNTALSGTP
jgi:hypothetical protein